MRKLDRTETIALALIGAMAVGGLAIGVMNYPNDPLTPACRESLLQPTKDPEAHRMEMYREMLRSKSSKSDHPCF